MNQEKKTTLVEPEKKDVIFPDFKITKERTEEHYEIHIESLVIKKVLGIPYKKKYHANALRFSIRELAAKPPKYFHDKEIWLIKHLLKNIY